jgi:hypothetical protein
MRFAVVATWVCDAHAQNTGGFKGAAGCVVPWHWHTPTEHMMIVSGTSARAASVSSHGPFPETAFTKKK